MGHRPREGMKSLISVMKYNRSLWQRPDYFTLNTLNTHLLRPCVSIWKLSPGPHKLSPGRLFLNGPGPPHVELELRLKLVVKRPVGQCFGTKEIKCCCQGQFNKIHSRHRFSTKFLFSLWLWMYNWIFVFQALTKIHIKKCKKERNDYSHPFQ